MATRSDEWSELHCHSFFSLLDSSASPEALVAQAKALGMAALALTDHDTMAGAMRFWVSAKQAGIQPIFGAEVSLDGGAHLTLLAETQVGYANLCRIITRSRCDAVLAQNANTWLGKVQPVVTWAMLHEHNAGLIVLTGCRRGLVAAALLRDDEASARDALAQLVDCFGQRSVFVELQRHDLADDNLLVRSLVQLARQFDLPIVATGNAHYAIRKQARLRDALIAINHTVTLAEAQRRGLLPPNHTFTLPDSEVMTRRFADLPEAIANTRLIAERCNVSLDFSDRRLPRFPDVPAGHTEFSFLYDLCHHALPQRYPDLKPHMLTQLARELEVIEQTGLAGFFLICWDVVREARRRGCRAQGRGSAVSSIVSYLLGIGNVEPLANNLLFERFLSADKFTMPDIDIDFDNRHRDDILAYVQAKYGHAHTAMVCNHVTYQARSALRDLGKALEFPEAVIDRLARDLDSHDCVRAAEQLQTMGAELDVGASRHPIKLLAELMTQMDGVVRHLSIHVGGVLVSARPLAEVVPTQPTTMPGRFVVEWDKNSVEDAGLIKLDILSLRTLGLVGDAVETIERIHGTKINLDALPLDDEQVWDMLARADTIGTFNVSSRAQQQMLPRTKPRNLEDLACEIAIIRPGPIQSGATNPYIKRRTGEELITPLHPLLEPVLRSTYQVILFQEDVLRVAMVIASFTATDADLLRRALARAKPEVMAELRERFLSGAAKKGVTRDDAEMIFAKLSQYAGFGFLRSHAAAFAQLSFQTLWLKVHYPTAFYCALLNAELGFYPPEVVVNDAKRHGIAVLPVDIHLSEWGYTVASSAHQRGAVRMGLNTIAGLGHAVYDRIAQACTQSAFANLADFFERVRLPKSLVSDLIRAGAFDGFGLRRDLLWQLGEMAARPTRTHDDEMMLPELVLSPLSVALPELSDFEASTWEYELMGLSTSGQFLRHYRPMLTRMGAMTSAQVKLQPAGRQVQVAGMVVVKQRPQTAKGILFLSFEDELGLVDVVVQPDEVRCFKAILREHLLIVEGVVQRSGEVVSVLARTIRQLTI